jgi:hypothetical protein
MSLSLQKELSFALQFTKLDMDQILALERYDIPQQIEALDARRGPESCTHNV